MNDKKHKPGNTTIEQYQYVLDQFSNALHAIREEERKRISRELHDDVGQLLAALRIDLTLLQKQHAQHNLTFPSISSMDLLLTTTVTALRRITAGLRPLALEKSNLFSALQSLQNDFEQRYGVTCHFHANEADLTLDDTLSSTVYRLIQESLSNIVSHALASQATIHCSKRDDNLHIIIEDDGSGMSTLDFTKRQSFGLIGMRERVNQLHGELAMENTGLKGTRITIRLPLFF